MDQYVAPPRRHHTAVAVAAALLLGGLLGTPARAVAASSPDLPSVPATTRPAGSPTGAFIVRYRDGTSSVERARVRWQARASFERRLHLIDADVVRPGIAGVAALAALRRDPRVLSVEPDQPVHLDAGPAGEPAFGYQWALENDGSLEFSGVRSRPDMDVDAPAAWSKATGAGVVVAVLDDGLDFAHTELTGTAWVNPDEDVDGVDDDGNGFVDDVHGANVCESRTTPADDAILHVAGKDFHGTAVASVIAGQVDGEGMTGIAPGARIMGVRFLVGTCARESLAIAALEYAVGEGARIVNASWGGALPTPSLDAAIASAGQQGVLFVAAAGNDGTSARHYPAASSQPNVLSVGALRPDGMYAKFANYGSWVDVAAPGWEILAANTAGPGHSSLAFWTGTSFAAPLTAGVAALVAEAHPELLGNPVALRAKVIRSGWRGSASVAAKTGFDRVVSAEYALDDTAPIQDTAATAAPRVGDAIGSTSVITHVAWPAASDDTGIDSYRVRVRRDGGAWVWHTTGTTGRGLDRSLALNGRYEFEIFARDAGGNEVSFVFPVRLVRSQESTPAATYEGTWLAATSTTASNSGLRYATSVGDSVSFSFTGRGMALVGPRSPGRGTADVYVDDVLVATVSETSATTMAQRVLFSYAWPEAGAHTVRFALAGPVGRSRFDVDAFLVSQ